MNRCENHPSCSTTMLCFDPKCKEFPQLCSACIDEQLHKNHQTLSALKFSKEVDNLLNKYALDNPLAQQLDLKKLFDSMISELDSLKTFLIETYYKFQYELSKIQNDAQKHLVELYLFATNNRKEEDIIKEGPKVFPFIQLNSKEGKHELQFKIFNPKIEEGLSVNRHISSNILKIEEEIKQYLVEVKKYINKYNVIRIEPLQDDESDTEFEFDMNNILKRVDKNYLLKTTQCDIEQKKQQQQSLDEQIAKVQQQQQSQSQSQIQNQTAPQPQIQQQPSYNQIPQSNQHQYNPQFEQQKIQKVEHEEFRQYPQNNYYQNQTMQNQQQSYSQANQQQIYQNHPTQIYQQPMQNQNILMQNAPTPAIHPSMLGQVSKSYPMQAQPANVQHLLTQQLQQSMHQQQPCELNQLTICKPKRGRPAKYKQSDVPSAYMLQKQMKAMQKFEQMGGMAMNQIGQYGDEPYQEY